MKLVLFKNKLNFFSILWGVFVLVSLSTIITFLFVGKDLFTSFPRYIDGILYGGFVGLAFWIGNWWIGYFTGTKINWKKDPRKANTISLLLFFGYGIVASISVPWIYYGFFHKHWGNLLNAVISAGFVNLSVDLLFVSVFYAKYLIKYYSQSLLREEELKRENLAAKYEALKNQVNPHFLFNSLNTLSGVVEQNPSKAVDFIKKLSDIYRYVLDQRDKELVPIEDELKFLNDYMHLAKIRHGEGLSLSIDTNLKNVFIVPLGLQMLIENALKHNTISDDMPLTIEITSENGYIEVKNNIQKKSSAAANNSVGLENLKSRYTYLCDKPVIIDTSGNQFVVKLPLIEKPTE